MIQRTTPGVALFLAWAALLGGCTRLLSHEATDDQDAAAVVSATATATATGAASPGEQADSSTPAKAVSARAAAPKSSSTSSSVFTNGGPCPKGTRIMGLPSTPGLPCMKICGGGEACASGESCVSMESPGGTFRVCDKPSAAPPATPPQNTKPMPAPAASVDRVPRNRVKDGPCPAGFTEQPGVEDHSECARNCKSDGDCHGRGCVDSDVGNGKVCSREASKPAPPKPVAACKAGETSIEGGRCAKSCTSDKDCGGKKCFSTSFQDPSAGMVNVKVCE